jgi:hypothetical protein
MDKFMRLVNMDADALHAYKQDPPGFVARWEASQKLRLSDDERAALKERDYIRLYGLGAHPFLLWSFTEAAWTPELPREELVRRYKEGTAKIGYPAFTT